MIFTQHEHGIFCKGTSKDCIADTESDSDLDYLQVLPDHVSFNEPQLKRYLTCPLEIIFAQIVSQKVYSTNQYTFNMQTLKTIKIKQNDIRREEGKKEREKKREE